MQETHPGHAAQGKYLPTRRSQRSRRQPPSCLRQCGNPCPLNINSPVRVSWGQPSPQYRALGVRIQPTE